MFSNENKNDLYLLKIDTAADDLSLSKHFKLAYIVEVIKHLHSDKGGIMVSTVKDDD